MLVIYWRELLLVCIVCIYVCMVSHNTLELVATYYAIRGWIWLPSIDPAADMTWSIAILLFGTQYTFYCRHTSHIIMLYISTFVKTQLKVRHLTTMFTRYIYTTMLPLKKWKYPYWHYSLCVAAVGKRSAYDIGF